jgi:hypothetical protein
VHSDCNIFPDVVSPQFRGKVRFTIIDIFSQHLACYEDDRLVRICNISTAKNGYPDFIGAWKIWKKSKDAVSSVWKDDKGNLFKMPYAVAIGGGYWIHQGTLPGYPASHGCVRMSMANARWYYNWARWKDEGCSYKNFMVSNNSEVAK